MVRPSFQDYLIRKKQNNPSIHWFFPARNSEPYLDQNLRPVAVAPHEGLGKRLADVVANTSRVCTGERNIIERSFARVFDQKLSGNKYPLSHQLTEASGSMPTPDQPKIAIWLDVMAVFRKMSKPYNLQYDLPPGISYSDQGHDLLAR